MMRRSRLLSWGFLSAVGVSVGVVACASGNGNSSFTGSSSNTAGQSQSSSSDTLGGPSNSSQGFSNNTSSNASNVGDGCQHAAQTFVPKIPIVYVLADRSGSEFDGADAGAWFPLRTATLSVIQMLQAQVAFGFGAYTGINPNTTAGMCPILDEVPIALNNYSAISSKYSSLGQPMFKAETPAELSLEHVGQELSTAALSIDAGAGQAGAKYILFVTDGETDFCDDGEAICPADAVTAEIQKLNAQGITTLILGIPSDVASTFPQILQGFANAGVGSPVSAPPLNNPTDPPTSPLVIYQQCNSNKGWDALYTAAGLPTGNNQGVSLGTYASPDASVTNAPLFSPTSATDVTSLTSEIATALQTVKSCSFDLQGQVQIDASLASEGSVTIDGATIPFDPNNGWTLHGTTTIDLVGGACTTWRTTGTNIDFNFPCEAIIPR